MIENHSKERTVLVTGGTGAIGKAIARLIALKDNYKVVILARNAEKAKSTVVELKTNTGNPNISFVIADLSNKMEIQKAAQEWTGPLHVLINNAGTTPRQRLETTTGIEMQFATNVLGYFWMTQFFTPILKQSAPSRIINVASYWAGNLELDDLEFKHRNYDNGTAYRQSKQANRMLTIAFAERLKASEISVNACHPGDVNSVLSKQLGFGGHESPGQGATTPVWLATSDEVAGITGSYFEHLHQTNCQFGGDKESIETLFRICEKY
ncbi:MAG: SDR family NAD(P)-dependent oxidoreductase [Bacteroidales bacterium]|nr:SDR family NAD(P)-dependent oxidoreductase [Bacteroidales bacterium]